MFLLKTKCARYSILFLLFGILLMGCSKERKLNTLPPSLHNDDLIKKEVPFSFTGKEVKLPIKDMQGSFFQVSGWLDNETILYVTETSEGSTLFSYNLVEGKSTLLYSSIYSIVTVTVSPTQKSILIHSAPNSNTGLVTVISSSGKIIMSSEIPSSELAFEWNEYDENLLLITSFSETWEYSTYTLNINKDTLTQVTIPQPFAYWSNVNELLYLDWRTESPSLSAPLKSYNLNSKVSVDVMEEVYQIETLEPYILAITIDQKEAEAVGTYTFFDKDFQQKSRLVLPQLSNYSGWVVPFYEFDDTSGQFYTFKPEYSSEIDTYAGDFDLIKFSIETSEEEVLIENLANEPISCSPNGAMCLYGYSFENLLLLEGKNKLPVVEQ